VDIGYHYYMTDTESEEIGMRILQVAQLTHFSSMTARMIDG